MLKKLILVGLCMFLLVSFVNADLCYQESANSTDDCSGTCSCYDTGNYYLYSGFIDWVYDGIPTIDGNWSSFDSPTLFGGVGSSYDLINYTKPTNALNSSLWRVKDTFDEVNITINDICFKQEILQLNVSVEGYGDDSYSVDWSCYNGTDFKSLRFVKDYVIGAYVYEEAMWWNVTEAQPPPEPKPFSYKIKVTKNNKLTIMKGWFMRIFT